MLLLHSSTETSLPYQRSLHRWSSLGRSVLRHSDSFKQRFFTHLRGSLCDMSQNRKHLKILPVMKTDQVSQCFSWMQLGSRPMDFALEDDLSGPRDRFPFRDGIKMGCSTITSASTHGAKGNRCKATITIWILLIHRGALKAIWSPCKSAGS